MRRDISLFRLQPQREGLPYERHYHHGFTTVSALETIIGKTPGSMNLKVIDHLDEGALHWISKVPLIFAAFGSTSSIGITLCGGAPGFAGGDNLEFRLPTAMIDDPSLARPGLRFGSVVLLPGVSETMRVNGKVAVVRDDEIVVAVEECFSLWQVADPLGVLGCISGRRRSWRTCDLGVRKALHGACDGRYARPRGCEPQGRSGWRDGTQFARLRLGQNDVNAPNQMNLFQ